MEHVLIVDDSQDLLEFFPFFLQKYELGCLTAHTKAEMYRQLGNTIPNLILLDVILLHEDGRAICKALKSTPAFEKIPVILMSASPGKLENHQAVLADDVLEKPFDIHELIDKMRKIMLM